MLKAPLCTITARRIPHRQLVAWIEQAGLRSEDLLFPSRMHDSAHLGTRVSTPASWRAGARNWVSTREPTHAFHPTKPTMLYRRAKNLRAVQLLLGHTKLQSTVRCLGIEVDDALGYG